MSEVKSNQLDLVSRLRLKSPRPRKLKLAVEKHGIYWVISDQGKPIAVVVRDVGVGGAVLEVLKFSPDAPDRPLVLPPYDYHYATRIGYGATFGWSVDHMFQSPDEADTLDLVEQNDSHVVFVHDGKFKDGSTVHINLRVGYDETIGQYAYDMTWDVNMTRNAAGAEFSNLFHRNLMHSDMRQREYDYGCYVRDGVGWEKYPVTIMVTGLQQNRLTHIPIPVGGGAGHMNRNGVIPMLIVRKSTAAIQCGSCNVCYDLHQTAAAPANKPTHIEARFVDTGPIVAADPNVVKTIELDDTRAVAFQDGNVCDFETTVSRRDPWAPGIWACEQFPGSKIVDDCAHTGKHSLRLESDGKEVYISPFFSAVITDNHANYEMSAWVKVEGDEKTEASIEFRPFRFTQAHPVSSGVSSVFGNQDWVHLRTTVNAGKVECAMPYLRLKGRGRAWFDEVLVRKV